MKCICSALVFSKEWWRDFTEQIGIPTTNSYFAIYCILVLGLLGMSLTRVDKRLPKIIFVILMGGLEFYYFGFFEPNPDWFLSTNINWLQRLLTIPIIVTILTVQCILTDEVFLADSLVGERRIAANNGICLSPLLLSALIAFLVYLCHKWTESLFLSNLIGYTGLLFILVVTSRLIQVKRLGNSSYLLFFVSMISLCGLIITMSFIVWTGILTLIVYIVVSSRNDSQKVFYTIKLKAEEGNMKCMHRLGNFYLNGSGIPKDECKAVECFQKAAENGEVKAYNDLARCFLKGMGVAADKEIALEYARKSMSLGCDEAKDTIGDIYFEQAKCFRDGSGVEKDTQKAMSLFEKAGEYGNSKAYNSLAKFYLQGIGVPIDGGKGLELAMKSYEMGNKKACSTISTYYRMGKFIPEDHVNGHKWDLIGAKAGNILCQIRLGIDYEKGYGVAKNEREACCWYKKVADNNEACQEDRGMASYRYGVLIGILGNQQKGKSYIRQAQKLGNKTAIDNGDKYLNS